MIQAARLDVVHVLLVHDGEIALHGSLRVDGLAHGLGQHQAGKGFVHEALALAVQPQAGCGSPGAERNGGCIAGYRTRMALDGTAGPAAHLVA